MIVSQFQSWAETASPPSRADGVSALARALLYSDLTQEQSRATIRALTAFLDDPSALVRRALADALASAAEAPHHIILALAEDQPSIAAIVLSRSPVLSDAELIDFAANGDTPTQCAIAVRPYLSAAVVATLAEGASADALVALASNAGATLPDAAIKRMVDRHGDRGALREALLARGSLPVTVRVELVAATASALAAFVTRRDWMSEERSKRITREATERATIAIAATSDLDATAMEALTAGLRTTGQLTVALTFRALLSGNRRLFQAALSDLSGMAPARVEGLIRNHESAGFAALYRKAGLPLPLMPAFRAALTALRNQPDTRAALSSDLVARVLATCGAINDGSLDSLVVLLRRFETEAARDDARVKVAKPAPVRPAKAIADVPPPPSAQREAMLLAAIDFDEAVPMERAVPMAQPLPARFTIDLAAIEAELLAA
jgi:uncharacterized protein (DUF2336 family)